MPHSGLLGKCNVNVWLCPKYGFNMSAQFSEFRFDIDAFEEAG